jgi:DNA polymerase/3'-5' exonuclease PolX
MAKGKEMSRRFALQLAKDWVFQNERRLVRAAIVGSVLRNHPTVHDVDVLVVPQAGALLVSRPPVNVFTTSVVEWESAVLMYAPGMSAIQMRIRAKSQGYLLNQYGLFLPHGRREAVRVKQICALIGVDVPDPVQRSLDGELVLLQKR